MTSIVYPFKLNGECEELRYSLRSLVNLQHDDVWLVGDRPDWATGVEYIETVQLDGKYKNLCMNIRTACLNPEISDPFIIFNDDFFIMRKVPEVLPFWRESIPDSLRRYYRRGMTEWNRHMMKIQGELGADTSYELHIPMVIHKEAMLEALDRAKPGPCWRTAYAAVADIGGKQLPDVKVMNLTSPTPSGPYASCSDKAFSKGVVGRSVRTTFPKASPYEVA